MIGVEARGDDVVLRPVIVEFQQLVATDPVHRMQLERMLQEEPQSEPHARRYAHPVDQLPRLLDEILTLAPGFGEDAMVMTPVAAVFDWAMSTPSGFAAFRNPRLNEVLGKVLRAWCEFSNSPDSRYVLNGSPTG